ncbi:hypothetical protein VZT92_009846 [Zoarces viviparus]|uniref:Uncharacterized protein n=1 Tax=Zoarces viviparus TaxID=48416 RepID=A0AAW1FD39_ZOAVI
MLRACCHFTPPPAVVTGAQAGRKMRRWRSPDPLWRQQPRCGCETDCQQARWSCSHPHIHPTQYAQQVTFLPRQVGHLRLQWR